MAESEPSVATDAESRVLLLAQNERLRAEKDRSDVAREQVERHLHQMKEDMAHLRDEISRLRAVLEPFAVEAFTIEELHSGKPVPDHATWYVRVGDIRKARAALSRQPEPMAPAMVGCQGQDRRSGMGGPGDIEHVQRIHGAWLLIGRRHGNDAQTWGNHTGNRKSRGHIRRCRAAVAGG